MLADAGTLDFGDLVLQAFGLLREAAGAPRGWPRASAHVLVDDFQDTSFAQELLLRLLVAEHGNVCVAGDDDQSIHRFRGASTKSIDDFRAEWPDAAVVRLGEGFPLDREHRRRRAGGRRAGQAGCPSAWARAWRTGEVAFWRCASERAQARPSPPTSSGWSRARTWPPEDVCVLVRSVRAEGQAVAAALEGAPCRTGSPAPRVLPARRGARPAGMATLLVDPGDAAPSCARSRARR